MKPIQVHPRLRAAILMAAALFFVLAAAYHDHDLHRASGERAVDDTCAVCKLARSTAQVAVPVESIHPDASFVFALFVQPSHAPAACALLPSSPRAPPLA